MKIKIISGANLNILEKRGAEYGGMTYAQLEEKIREYAKEYKAQCEFFVSNFEGEIIEQIQSLNADALIINAGGFSHYSLAILDALKSVCVPKIEVHLTNIHARSRHVSVTGEGCDGVITGFGAEGYRLAISHLCRGK